MLTHTFCHIPGIGTALERHLWSRNICTWEQFLTSPDPPLSPARSELARELLHQSTLALEREDPRYFTQRLPASQYWRLFPQFRGSTAYLDIETSGPGGYHDMITCIALYDGKSVHSYVQGENLEQFAVDILRHRLLVTYNGSGFDMPFIRRRLGLAMDQAHLDLMHLLRSLGFRGGLKGCEQLLGLDRGGLSGLHGYHAVLLWREYQSSGDRRLLETLQAYNCEDVVNLESLLIHACNLKLAETPFAEDLSIPLSGRPEVPYRADAGIIRSLLEAQM